MKVDDPITVEAPFGNFTFEGESGRIGLLSGGVGITPLRSICKYCTDMKLNTKVTLLYGNRTEEDIVFREDLEQMQRQNNNLRAVFTLSEPKANWKGHTGNIDVEMIKKKFQSTTKPCSTLVVPPPWCRPWETSSRL